MKRCTWIIAVLLALSASALAQDDKSARSHYERAMEKSDPVQRLFHLQQAVRLAPRAATYRYALGREFYQRSLLDSALVHFEAVMVLDGALAMSSGLEVSLPQIYSTHASRLLAQGLLSQAQEAIQSALRHDPDFTPALATALLIYHQAGKLEQAIEYGARLIKLEPAAQHYNNLGAAYEAHGDLAQAKQCYRRALELLPSIDEARSNLARVQERLQPHADPQHAAAEVKATHVPPLANSTKTIHAQRSSQNSKRTSHAAPSRTRSRVQEVPLARMTIGATRNASQPLELRASRDATHAAQRPPAGRGASFWLISTAVGGLVIAFVYYRLRVKTRASAADTPPLERDATTGKRSTQINPDDNTPVQSSVATVPTSAAASLNNLSPASEQLDEVTNSTAVRPAIKPQLKSSPVAATSVGQEKFDGNGQSDLIRTEELFADLVAERLSAFEEEQKHKDEHRSSDIEQPPHTENTATEATSLNAESQRLSQSHSILAAPPSRPPQPSEAATRTVEITAMRPAKIDRYLIEQKIFTGAKGEVYKAWDPKLDRPVVIKTMRFGLGASEREIALFKERLYLEARAIARLRHANIVTIYDVDDRPEYSFFVMEYLNGRDLKQLLEREHHLEYHRALELGIQVCEAMAYAHQQGIYHRDIKPSNLMLLAGDHIKVLDFGIAKVGNHLTLTQPGKVLGTPCYMAPEQLEGEGVSASTDLFALGVVLYELLVGKRPFAGDSLAALAYKIVHKAHIPPSLENLELPMEIDTVINRALAKKPEDRFDSAAEFRSALEEVSAMS